MSSTPLSPSGEAAWQSLRTHLEWAPGFWLGWIFTNHPPSGRELFARAADLLRSSGRVSELRQPSAPEDLTSDTPAWLFGDGARVDGCIAVQLSRIDAPWADAWDQFLLRLNMRREWLRQHIRGGLLLIAPDALKASSRTIAPDLWSIRSLVLDVAPPPPSAGLVAHPARVEHHVEAPGSADLPLALQAIEAARSAGQAEAETDARLRAATALLAMNRGEEARKQATLAVQIAPSPQARAHALATLGQLEQRLGAFAAAEQHYRAALDLDPAAPPPEDLRALASLLAQRGELDRALDVARRALAGSRLRADETRGSGQGLRDEFRSLLAIGNIQRDMGSWNSAGETMESALVLCRRLTAMEGTTWRNLWDEALCLHSLGHVRWNLGDWPAAISAAETSLALFRRVRAVVGDTPMTLRGEFVVLVLISLVRQGSGEPKAAAEAADAGLALLDRLRVIAGETAELLRDESVLLDTLYDIRRSQGQLAEAADALERSLALSRRVRALEGDTPDTLRDEGISLYNLGILHGLREDWAAAAQSLESGLDLLRRSRAMTGDTPRMLGDIASCLVRLASAREHLGQRAHARALLEEAEELLRAEVALEPTPQARDLLAEVQRRLAVDDGSAGPSNPA